MATSGTVGQTTINTARIIDLALGRCRLTPQQITSETMRTARDLLWLQLSALNTRNISLWAIDKQLLGFNEGTATIPTTAGNLDLLNLNFRTIVRIDGTASSTSGTASNAYDQDLATSCTEIAPAGSVTITFTTTQGLTNVGFVPNVTAASWTFTLLINTGSGFVTYATYTQAVTAGKWVWLDIDGYDSVTAIQILAGAATTLDVREIVCGNAPQDIPMGVTDRDTYVQLSNKSFLGKPVQAWWDRQRPAPVLHVWPAPSSSYIFTSLIVMYVQRQLQDVGTMVQQIELPDRWLLPTIADLARNCAMGLKEVDRGLIPDLAADADRLLTAAWNGESDGSVARLLPNLACYNR